MVVDLHFPAGLRVESARIGPDLILTPGGELDVANSERLCDAILLGGLAAEGTVTVDLRQLRFIDVSGVRALLEAARLLGPRLRLLPAPAEVQRVFALTGTEARLPFPACDNVMPFPGAAERNLKYVKRIWDAFIRDGLAAVLALVPPDVEWRPWQAGGRVLRGSAELQSFYDGRPVASSGTVGRYRSIGLDVLVRTGLPLEPGHSKPLFSLYEFDRGMLVRQTSYERERDAVVRSV